MPVADTHGAGNTDGVSLHRAPSVSGFNKTVGTEGQVGGVGGDGMAALGAHCMASGQ